MTADGDDAMKWTAPEIREAVLDKRRTTFWNDAQFLEVMRLAGVGPGCRIVDVGAGTGGMLDLFGDVLAAHPGARLTCVDRDAGLVAAAAARAAELGLADRVETIAADAAALPVSDASADLAFCQTVLMHVADAGAVIREMARIVRPGGSIVVVEGNAVTSALLAARGSPEVAAEVAGMWQRIRIGRLGLGRGDLVIGETVPGMLAAAGIELTAARLIDRVHLPGPDLIAMYERGATVFEAWRPGFEEAFVAAGGSTDGFARAWQTWRATQDQLLADLRAGRFPGLVAGLLYAFVGRTADRAGG